MLIWQPMQSVPRALEPILFIPGLLYEALVRARNGLYAKGLFTQHRLPGPVISVGNITVGGSGKTPLVIHIAQLIAERGFQPAILTRGYGRDSSDKTVIVRPGELVPSAARVLGDEPAVIRRHVPSSWMGISRNRLEAGRSIAQMAEKPVFILDDGFQHRQLGRDLDIVMLDGSQPMRSNRVMPRGTLREPLSGLRRCHAAVVNGVREAGAASAIAENFVRYNSTASVFFCSQKIGSVIPFTSWSGAVSQAWPRQPRSAFLVAALGNPGRFEQDVRQYGIEVAGTKLFRDHHWPTPGDWSDCVHRARRLNAECMITTEKDAVKISQPPDFPLFIATQSTVIFRAGDFHEILTRCVEGRLRELSGFGANGV